MKSTFISIVTLIVGLVFIAFSASATTLEATLSADCESYTINVSGVTWKSFEANYSLTLTPISGDAVSVEGTFFCALGFRYENVQYKHHRLLECETMWNIQH